MFVGAHPNNNPHRHGTYLEVQRLDGSNWRRIADDGDWPTKFPWKREGLTASRATVTWDIPADAEPGSHRIR